ncbi:Protein arginine N-methyltransferase 8-B [Balamuthia mandrillaris]
MEESSNSNTKPELPPRSLPGEASNLAAAVAGTDHSGGGSEFHSLPSNAYAAAATPSYYDAYEDSVYFGEYGKMKIHCDMLKDEARMISYHGAIMRDKEVFKDRVVLDVGCGSGILSCFCAKAGARKVYSVEASDMWHKAELVVLRNGLEDVVQVINGKMEEVQLPEKVDIIVSEWMGSFLVFEGMLESVLFARDRWLKEGGRLYPDIAKLYLVPVDMSTAFHKRTSFLKDVCGIDMSPLAPFIVKEYTKFVVRGKKVKASTMLAESALIKTFDLESMRIDELAKITGKFSFRTNKSPGGTFHGFALWFEVIFSGRSESKEEEDIILSTSPEKVITHWRHDAVLWPKGIAVREGEEIAGLVRLCQNAYYVRHYDVHLSFSIAGEHDVYRVFSS